MNNHELAQALLQISHQLLSGDISIFEESIDRPVTPEIRKELDPNLVINYGALASIPDADVRALKIIRETILLLKEPIQVKLDNAACKIFVQCSEVATNKIIQSLQQDGIRWVNLKPTSPK